MSRSSDISNHRSALLLGKTYQSCVFQVKEYFIFGDIRNLWIEIYCFEKSFLFKFLKIRFNFWFNFYATKNHLYGEFARERFFFFLDFLICPLLISGLMYFCYCRKNVENFKNLNWNKVMHNSFVSSDHVQKSYQIVIQNSSGLCSDLYSNLTY